MGEMMVKLCVHVACPAAGRICQGGRGEVWLPRK